MAIDTSLTAPTLALYLGAAALLWRSLGSGTALTAGLRTGIFELIAGALVLHGAPLYTDLLGIEPNVGLTNAASLIAWAITLLFLLAALFQPVESLGLLILPLAALALLLEWLVPTQHLILPGASPLQSAQIVVSFLAYSLLSIAVVQGMMLGLQERALHQRHAGGFLRNLPPLETMERLLFRMIGLFDHAPARNARHPVAHTPPITVPAG